MLIAVGFGPGYSLPESMGTKLAPCMYRCTCQFGCRQLPLQCRAGGSIWLQGRDVRSRLIPARSALTLGNPFGGCLLTQYSCQGGYAFGAQGFAHRGSGHPGGNNGIGSNSKGSLPSLP